MARQLSDSYFHSAFDPCTVHRSVYIRLLLSLLYVLSAVASQFYIAPQIWFEFWEFYGQR